MSKRTMFIVYSIHTGKVIDIVPTGVQCFSYPCPDGETIWTRKEDWAEVCATNGWKP